MRYNFMGKTTSIPMPSVWIATILITLCLTLTVLLIVAHEQDVKIRKNITEYYLKLDNQARALCGNNYYVSRFEHNNTLHAICIASNDASHANTFIVK